VIGNDVQGASVLAAEHATEQPRSATNHVQHLARPQRRAWECRESCELTREHLRSRADHIRGGNLVQGRPRHGGQPAIARRGDRPSGQPVRMRIGEHRDAFLFNREDDITSSGNTRHRHLAAEPSGSKHTVNVPRLRRLHVCIEKDGPTHTGRRSRRDLIERLAGAATTAPVRTTCHPPELVGDEPAIRQPSIETAAPRRRHHSGAVPVERIPATFTGQAQSHIQKGRSATGATRPLIPVANVSHTEADAPAAGSHRQAAHGLAGRNASRRRSLSGMWKMASWDCEERYTRQRALPRPVSLASGGIQVDLGRGSRPPFSHGYFIPTTPPMAFYGGSARGQTRYSEEFGSGPRCAASTAATVRTKDMDRERSLLRAGAR